MCTLHLLLVLTTSVVAVRGIGRSYLPKDVTIDAAFRFNGDLILISQFEYMAITPQGVQRYVKSRSGITQVPVGEHIQAAVHWPTKPTVYYYGAEHSFNTNMETKTSLEKEYKKYREFLQGGGPDAAAYKKGWFYIFKGCQYVAQNGTLYHLGEPQNITDIDEGLPCDIDAAWTDVNTRGMTILKGDEIWKWKADDEVEGPVAFESEYLIWSWQLRHTTDDTFQL